MISTPLLFAVLSTTPTSYAGDSTIGIGLSTGALVTERTDVIGNSVLLNPRIGYWPDENIGVELDVTLMPFDETSVGTPETFPYFGALPALNLVGRVLKDQPINLIFNVGAGPFIKNIQDEGELGLPYDGLDIDFALLAGPGLLVPIGPLALRGEARWLISVGPDNYENRGQSFSHAQFNLGLMWLPLGPYDEDKDGINDDDDRCMTDPEDLDGFQDLDGCPDLDNDGDQVADDLDGCPDEPEDVDGFEDDDGCPELDNDEDGLEDGEDRCPDEAGPEATDGCPDADGDLVADLDDECDEVAGAPEAYGCIDSDGDFVPDYRDECPEDKAPKGIDTRRADGCVKRAYIGQQSIITLGTINFDSRNRLRRASRATLDDAAAIMVRLPALKKVEVQAHTDSVGDDEDNLELSQKSADAIVEYLVGQGVEPARLTAVGYGESKPIADNETEEGRRQNNRIVLAILEQDEPDYEQPAPGENDAPDAEGEEEQE